mgnify:FL=1
MTTSKVLNSNLIQQGDCITNMAEMNTKMNLLKKELAVYKSKDLEREIKLKDKETDIKNNDKYLCDIEKSDSYIDKLEKEAKKYNEGYLKPTLGGVNSNYKLFKNELNSILNGGIIPKLKKKYKKMISNEYKKISKIRGGGLKGGANPTLILILSIGKIFLMTAGTFIFDWWPVVVLISAYCAYVEYSMLLLTDKTIVGLDGLSILLAFLCPCCWTAVRLYKGWETVGKKETDNLWNIIKKCSPYLTMPVTEVNSESCQGTSCYLINKECYKSIYETNKDYVGFFGSSDNE